MERPYIPREHYLKLIRGVRDLPLIKVITGIRRCGKSTLMEMFIDELRSSGIPDERIIHINLDDADNEVSDHHDLLELVRSRVPQVEGSYLFFDEVQNVDGWEKAVNSFYIHDADVYITGSNSNMLSSEPATHLSGRTLEITVFPLSFSEYTEFRPGIDTDTLLDDYIRYGGFPAVALAMDRMPYLTMDILDGIHNTIFNRDITGRHNIRNHTALSHVSGMLMGNLGDRTSVRDVARNLTDRGIRTQPQTVDEYIRYLEEAMLFSRSKRMDLKTKEYLRTTDKFYITDLGIRNSQTPFHIDDMDGILENIVYNELRYRFRDVAVCDQGRYEVDFVADPVGSPSYYQVSMSILDPETREREIRPLRMIGDNHPKTVITLDGSPVDDIDGIRIVRLRDWLLEGRDTNGPL